MALEFTMTALEFQFHAELGDGFNAHGLQFRRSDDGEPGGTAGAPILNAITGEGLDGVCVLVTRCASYTMMFTSTFTLHQRHSSRRRLMDAD